MATNPESGAVNYTYDGAGNLLTEVYQRNATTTITTTYGGYNKLNRPGTISYSDSTPEVTFAYDGAGVSNSKGQVTSVGSTGVSMTSYTNFNTMGQVLASSQATAGQCYPFSYTYNLAGQLTSETYSSGRVVSTGYDGASPAQRC